MKVNRSCSHQVPLLVQPLQWSCRQIRNIFILKGCAAKTAQFGKTFFALLIITPSCVIAIIGIGFKVIRNKPEKVCNLCFPPKKETTPKPVSTPPKPKDPVIVHPPIGVSNFSTPVQTQSQQTSSSTQPTPNTNVQQTTSAQNIAGASNQTSANTTPAPSVTNSGQIDALTTSGTKVLTKEVLEQHYQNLLLMKDSDQIFMAGIKFFEDYDMNSKTTLNKDFSSLGERAQDQAILESLFAYDGFGVGECHNNHGAKIFFMKNIPFMKAFGVNILFFEGIDYKDQPLLDKWYRKETLTPEETEHLNEIFLSVLHFKDSPQQNNDFTILLQARDWGMRIVGIDYKCGAPVSSLFINRLIMNYVAFIIAQHELKNGDKYAALMGTAHLVKVKDSHKVPGFAELMGCPSVEVIDRPVGEPRLVFYNQEKSLSTGREYINPINITIFCRQPIVKPEPKKPDTVSQEQIELVAKFLASLYGTL